MISESFRVEILGIVDKFNQDEFESGNSFYFVRFCRDFVYIDRCSNGRIELFSRLRRWDEMESLVIEIHDGKNDEFRNFITGHPKSRTLRKPLMKLMEYGMESIKNKE